MSGVLRCWVDTRIHLGPVMKVVIRRCRVFAGFREADTPIHHCPVKWSFAVVASSEILG